MPMVNSGVVIIAASAGLKCRPVPPKERPRAGLARGQGGAGIRAGKRPGSGPGYGPGNAARAPKTNQFGRSRAMSGD